MHTKKVILLPKEATETSKSIDPIIQRFETAMINVLDQNISADAKMAKYNSLFSRYQNLVKQKNEPYKLQVLEKTEPLITDSVILEDIPSKSLSHAELLLKYIRENPSIDVKDNGEVIVDGHIIQGSNIVDIVHDLSRKRKAKAVSTGVEEVARALNRSNIPLEAIGNTNRLNFFNRVAQWVE